MTIALVALLLAASAWAIYEYVLLASELEAREPPRSPPPAPIELRLR